MDNGYSDSQFPAFLAGGGEMGERTRRFDWSQTPVGPVADWPQSLKTIVRTMLSSRYAMWLGWGPEFTFFYNDAYGKMTLGPKHPWALGRAAREVWSEIWGDIGPRAESVIRTGEATWDEGLLLFLERQGFPEETYHTFSYSPVPDDAGGIGGMLCVVTEDTERTISERRLRTLRELAARTTDEARSVEDACQTAAAILAGNPYDLPFILLYLLDRDGERGRRVGLTGVDRDLPVSPAVIDVAEQQGSWPFRQVIESGQAVLVRDLPGRFGPLQCGAWSESPQMAMVLPLAKPGQTRFAGFLVAGVSPRRPFDDGYRGFLELVAGQIATAVSNARAYEEERRRAEALAELDRAKTAFFSNISHEFRTPLTLMLGPVEDLLAGDDVELPPVAQDRLELVNRNGLRLLRLVNSLLDFSRIEAGRVRAVYQPTDLAAFTADLASLFRSACDRAGLQLTVDCPPLSGPVYVDREMWEKVVLNLLSNAFKFTLDGEIAVSLRETGSLQETGSLRETGATVELSVRDTGTGIPADEMPRLFERFHRIENAHGRTHEGSGIGLALVQELVKLHGGSVTAESAVGTGTTFRVTLPLGQAHLPAEHVRESGGAAATGAGASPFIEEALRWLPDAERPDQTRLAPSATLEEPPPVPISHFEQTAGPFEQTAGDRRSRVLIADDNADMRQYVVRLLAERYQVEAVSDGEAALAAVRKRVPDLILTDVMMPRLDGFGLLRELRANPQTSGLPVIMLSARAGEESRVEGMEAGADDYLVKPFSARELLARVGAHLQMARLRRETNESIRLGAERLRMALAAARMVVWEMNPATGEVTASESAAEVFGLPPGSLPKYLDHGIELLHPEDRETHLAIMAKAMRECGSYLSHFRVIRPDNGQTIWLEERGRCDDDESGRAVRMVGVVMDVTERKQAELLVRENEQRFRTLVEQVKDYAIFMTDPEGRPTSWNEGVRQVLGFEEEEFLGRDITPRIFTPEDRADGIPEAEFEEAAATGSSNNDRWMMRKDGSRFFAVGITSALHDESDELIGYMKVMRDQTKQKTLEDDLRRVAAELSEANRRKTEFLATLGHELRNPLAPIRTGLELMRLLTDDPVAMEETRSVMERQAQQLVRLIDDLLDVSRITQGKLQLRKAKVELAEVVRSAIEASRPFVDEASHQLTVSLPAQPILLDADPNRLAQVFSNLLNNSTKYTPEGGRILLAAERQGREAVVTVTDNGLGIPAEMQTSIFEMFTQIDRPLEMGYKGLGIGLTLVKRLIEMHGGSVAVESAGEGRGSTFHVRLPIQSETPVAKPQPAASRTAAAKGRLRILVVDDNKAAADTLGMVVRMLGNEIRTAYDGVQGVAAAEEFRPDVVLMDLGMPRMNGYEAARHLREQEWGRTMLLVALTGWGQEEDRQRTREAGFDHHLVKPAEPAALQKLFAEVQPGPM